MPLFDQVELLCQAIHSQSREEAEKILAHAREEAERLVAAAEAQGREVLDRTRFEVESQARLEARNRIDRAELERKRQTGQTKEQVLSEVFSQTLDRLQAFRTSDQYPNWLRQALSAALAQMEGEKFQVVANPEEGRWLTQEMLNEMGKECRVSLELAPDPDTPPGGFLLVRGDGRVRVDLTFQGIIERRREALRAEAAQKLWGS